jgi:hypothetical protein
MEIQTRSHLAATKQTWRKASNAREVFAQIAGANPRGGEAAWRKAFRAEIKANDDAFDAVVDYTFDACFRAYMTVLTNRDGKAAAQRAISESQRNQRAAAAAEFIKEKIIALNLEMPNGKRARFCSLDYFYRLGGAYRRVGKKGDHSLIGSKYNEQQFRSKLADASIFGDANPATIIK